MEFEINNKWFFLDIWIDNSCSNGIKTTILWKETFTGVLLNYFSFSPPSYKIGTLRTLIDRIYKINNTWMGFHVDFEHLKNILSRNAYPIHLIDKVVNGYLGRTFKNASHSETEPEVGEENHKIVYIKLPYIGFFSQLTQKKINSLVKRFCKNNIKVRVTFSTFKVKDLFCVKDAVPMRLRSCVVYNFSCLGCNSQYVGETTRHYCTRMHEHLETDKLSHIYKHLNKNSNCKNLATENCFQILDSDISPSKLKIKEAFYIKWKKPDLNGQIKSEKISLNL